jgi:hypothetical protein
MESIIRGAQEEMQASQAAADEARVALAAERAARMEAEQSTSALQRELSAITAAEERARVEAQQQLLSLQAEYEAAKGRLVELQAAKPKRAPRAKKVAPAADSEPAAVAAVSEDTNGTAAAAVNGAGEADAYETVAAPKRRGRPKKATVVGGGESSSEE